jgi:hypothetical protein
MRTVRLAFLLLAFVPLAVFARSAELVDPEPIVLTVKATSAQVKKAVKTSLLNRQWELSNEKPGYVEGKYTKPKFWAKIGVSYDTRKVTIRYLDSEGLNYEKEGEQRVIHPNYNKWIGNLLKDIPIYLQRELTAAE